MNATASDAADNLSQAGREATADLRRRGSEAARFATGELRAFLADVEELVRRVANVSDVDIARARARVVNALSEVRRIAGDTADNLGGRARVAMDATDEYVRERPWTAIGLAGALGLLIGVGVAAASRRS